jgi:hypothetical protein
VTASSREQIVQAAKAAGWTTRRGYTEDAPRSAAWAGNHPDGRTVNVEFNSRGGITWAWGTTTADRNGGPLNGTGRLTQVLAWVKEGKT